MSRKQFCSKGHDTFIVGRASNRSCRECARQSCERWRRENPEANKLSMKSHNLKRKFKLTIEELDQLIVNQKHSCAICGMICIGDTKQNKLHIDHDHMTGNVRELLCMQCNFGLGHFMDNPYVLRKAADYIESHSTRVDATKEVLVDDSAD